MAALRLLSCSLLALLLSASASRSSLRKGKAAVRSKQLPEDNDEYEYGDRESEVSHSDSSDFSVHQFLVDDDGREAKQSTDGDGNTAEDMARQKALSDSDHFGSEDTPDNTDSFVQTGGAAKAATKHHSSGKSKRRQSPGDDEDEEGDGFEYGDREMQVSHDDSSDFSVHQFLADDDARDVSASVDNDDTKESMARSKAMAADDHFNSEDTPDSSDSFAQTGRKVQRAQKAQKAQAADAGSHRGSAASKRSHDSDDDDDDDDNQDEFEHGDREAAVSQSDSADFSVHQFLVDDDARVAASRMDSGDNKESAARDRAMAADDHFNSEDTPDTTDSFAQTGRKSRKAKTAKKQMPDDDDDDNQDEFEHGDREAAVSQADAADFSVHQFLTNDDARDVHSSVDGGDAREDAARARAEAADDHFNSEDTPDNTDSFAQTGRQSHKAAAALRAEKGAAQKSKHLGA